MKLYYAWPRGALTETHWPGAEGPLPSRHDAELALVQALAGGGGEVVTASSLSGKYLPHAVARRAETCDGAVVSDYLGHVSHELAGEIQALMTEVPWDLPVFLLRHDLQGGEVDGKLIFAGTGADTLVAVDGVDLADPTDPIVCWGVVRASGEPFPATAGGLALAIVNAGGA